MTFDFIQRSVPDLSTVEKQQAPEYRHCHEVGGEAVLPVFGSVRVLWGSRGWGWTNEALGLRAIAVQPRPPINRSMTEHECAVNGKTAVGLISRYSTAFGSNPWARAQRLIVQYPDSQLF